jgi:hypothetical protein
MTLRWLEGGLGCQNEVIFGRLYASVTGTIAAAVADHFGRNVFSSGSLILTTPALVSPVANVWVTGFRFNMVSGTLDASPSAFPGIMFKNSVGEQIRIEAVNTSSTAPGNVKFKLRVMRGATELARTVEEFSQTLSIANWTYFEWKVTINTGTGGSFSLKYHTHKVRDLTATWDAANSSINTANQGTAGADRAAISWATGGVDRLSLTDIYILDSAGAKNNDMIGEIYMENINPAGNGNTLQWILAGGATSIEDALNEGAAVQTVAEDDKGITSDVIGNISLATMSDLVKILNTTIVGVQTRLYGKMDTGGTRNVQFFYRKTTGTPAQIGSGKMLVLSSTSFAGAADTLENDPNTGVTWVIADINAVQMGVELNS